jgi:hypothetical protein
MTQFVRTLLAESGVAKVHSEALGDNTNQFGNQDVGALVKLAANSYVQCADGDEIGGQVASVEEFTVNDGYAFGTVKKSHRIKAIVGANGDTTAVTVGALVVADVQPALKGKLTSGSGGDISTLGHVKVGTPTLNKWQVIYVSGAGAAGEEVILEKM